MPIRGTHRARSRADLRARPVFFLVLEYRRKTRGSITALRMPPVRADAELAHRRDSDRRRREVRQCGGRVRGTRLPCSAPNSGSLCPEKRGVDFVPVRVGQVPRGAAAADHFPRAACAPSEMQQNRPRAPRTLETGRSRHARIGSAPVCNSRSLTAPDSCSCFSRSSNGAAPE